MADEGIFWRLESRSTGIQRLVNNHPAARIRRGPSMGAGYPDGSFYASSRRQSFGAVGSEARAVSNPDLSSGLAVSSLRQLLSGLHSETECRRLPDRGPRTGIQGYAAFRYDRRGP